MYKSVNMFESSDLKGIPSGWDISKPQLSLESDHLPYHIGQFADGTAPAAAEIDRNLAVIVRHRRQTGVGQVVDEDRRILPTGGVGVARHCLFPGNHLLSEEICR